MSQRLAVALVAVLALAGCGHSRSEQQARTGTRSVTTRATPTVTTTVPTTTAPLPTTVPKPKPARRLLVGAVEDEAKFAPTDVAARADMARARDAGFRAIAFSAFWRPPLRQLKPLERDGLRRAVRTAVAASITPVVDVAQFGRDTPLTDAEREEFASFAASVPRLVPAGRARRRRQRAEHGLFLEATVPRVGRGRGRSGVRAPPCADLRRNQGCCAACGGDRRRPRPARRRPAVREAADALPDRFYPGPRQGLSRQRSFTPTHGRVLHARLRGGIGCPADPGAPVG